MAYGRSRCVREQLIEQAALVWCLGETDVAEFIRCGQLPAGTPGKMQMAPALEAEVDKRIQEIMTTGRLVIE